MSYKTYNSYNSYNTYYKKKATQSGGFHIIAVDDYSSSSSAIV